MDTEEMELSQNVGQDTQSEGNGDEGSTDRVMADADHDSPIHQDASCNTPPLGIKPSVLNFNLGQPLANLQLRVDDLHSREERPLETREPRHLTIVLTLRKMSCICAYDRLSREII